MQIRDDELENFEAQGAAPLPESTLKTMARVSGMRRMAMASQ